MPTWDGSALRISRLHERMPMNVKPIQVPFSAEEVTEILRISLDEDREQALQFMKTVLSKHVEKALQRH